MNRAESCAAEIRQRFLALAAGMNEVMRRRWAAAEAQALGYRGLSAVSRATGISRPTIRRGLRELQQGESLPSERIRRPGGGRKPLLLRDPGLLSALDHLIGGPPASAPLHGIDWVPSELRQRLGQQGHALSLPTLLRLLHERGYHWHAAPSQVGVPAKTPAKIQGAQPLPQWSYIAARVQQFLRCRQPVVLARIPSAQTAVSLSAESTVGPGSLQPSTRPAAPKRSMARTTKDEGAMFWAALRALVPQILAANRDPARELLLLVQPPRLRSAPFRWQRALRRLALDLGLRVQLILLPRGTYRMQAAATGLHCNIQRGGSADSALALSLLLLAPPDHTAEVAARVYARAYPQGLIGPPTRQRGDSSWTLSAWPRRSHPRTAPSG